MIDTIRLTVHDILGVHEQFFRTLTMKTEFTKYRTVSSETLLERDVFVMESEGKAFEMFRKSSLFLPSSNYKITIRVSIPDDNAVIEFSLPKYFFGQNVSQICFDPSHRDFFFDKGHTDTPEFQFSKGFRIFRHFLKTFFATEFSHCDFDFSQIQINRIDFCFNQVFDSEKEALQYLEYQKRLKKKYMRIGSEPVKHKTSIFIKNDRYSFKIYHKGSEFRKNDYKRLEKSLYGGASNPSLIHFTNFADRILRYEMTFRDSYISQIYNSKIFRMKVKDFRFLKSVHSKLKSLDDKGLLAPDVPDFLKLYDEFKRINFDDTYFGEYLNRHFIRNYDPGIYYSKAHCLSAFAKFYRVFSSILTKKRDFFLTLHGKAREHALKDRATFDHAFQTFNSVIFNSEIFDALSVEFLSVCRQFVLQKKDSFSVLMEKLNAYNEQVERDRSYAALVDEKFSGKTLNPQRFKIIFLAMQNRSLQQVADLSGMERTTFYRLCKDLEKIGVFKTTVIDTMDINAPFDYSAYFYDMILNSHSYSAFLKKVF